jgi:hypothetical protein
MQEGRWIVAIIKSYPRNPDFLRPGRYERELMEYTQKRLIKNFHVHPNDVIDNFNFEKFIKVRIKLLRGTPEINLLKARRKHIKKYGQRNRGLAETPEERVAFMKIGQDTLPFKPSGKGFENLVSGTSPPPNSSNDFHIGPYSGDFQLFYKTTALVPRPPLPLVPDVGVPSNPSKHPMNGTLKIVPEQEITKELVQEWALVAAADKTRGGESQIQVMGCSARDAILAANYGLTYTDSSQAKAEWECEWLHLVAYSMGGINGSPQQHANLVAGLSECNSAMISVEDAVKDIVTSRNQKLFISVRATCIPNTHVATRIIYEIRKNQKPKGFGPDWVYSITFNPLWPNDQVKGDTSLVTASILKALDLT